MIQVNMRLTHVKNLLRKRFFSGGFRGAWALSGTLPEGAQGPWGLASLRAPVSSSIGE